MFARDPLQLLDSLGFVSLTVLAILLVFSVFSWGIILHKWRLFRLIKREERQFLETYRARATCGANDLKALRSLAQTLPGSPSGSVFLGLVSRVSPLIDSGVSGGTRARRRPDRQYLEKVSHALVQSQIARQEAYLPFLATTGTITPFIGLLGTVVGVINAFHTIGIEGTASIAAVAPGVSEALLATAAGLFAAIPAVIGYNAYLAKIRKTVFDVEAFSVELLNALERTASDREEAANGR